MKITGLMTIATLSATMVAAGGAAFAESTSVSRCSFTEGAAYLPGLWVTKNGVTRLIKVNEEGLTRRIIFNDKLAMEYVRAQSGSDGGSSNVSMTNPCSNGATFSNTADKDTVVAVVIEKPEICEGKGCGPTDCGPTDCGPTDCGPTDCGPTDCGPTDCGPTDCGPTDCGPTDCGPTDCGPTDCGPWGA